ncbi:MAG: hypothetical protein LBN25_00950 [Christensenellaceae bacterium]|jgi:hypothetical protein|nr:hypothetical protein [Christensenellaceae bacterium]
MKENLLKAKDAFVRFCRHEITCIFTLIVALTYDMFYLDIYNPLQYSLSAMGRLNIPLFIIWSFVTGIALTLNILRMYDRIGYKKKLARICLLVGMLCLIATFSNMSDEPIPYTFHVISAAIFAGLTFLSMALALLTVVKKSKKMLVLVAIFFALMLTDVVFLAIYKQMGLFETAPLIVGVIVLFFTNYTKFFEDDFIKSGLVPAKPTEEIQE